MGSLVKPEGSTSQKKRKGRGTGSGLGTTAGKGNKGQNSRSGGGVRLGFEGGQMPLFRRVARRGFSNYPFKERYTVVKLSALERVDGASDIDLQVLVDCGLVKRSERLVKVLCGGKLSRALTIKGLALSKSAAAAVVAAGGVIVDCMVGGGTEKDIANG